MLANIAAVQMTPDAFIVAGSAGLGVGARPVMPSRLELAVETVTPVPYRRQAVQPSAEQLRCLLVGARSATKSDPGGKTCAWRRATVRRFASVSQFSQRCNQGLTSVTPPDGR